MTSSSRRTCAHTAAVEGERRELRSQCGQASIASAGGGVVPTLRRVADRGAVRNGRTRTPLLANLMAYWFIGLPQAYVLCFRLGWGALGVWVGLCLGLIIIGSALLVAWHQRLKPGKLIEAAAAGK